MPGPYVQLAVVCEKVLQERDGVLSLIRVIDRLSAVAPGPDAPPELPEGLLRVTYVISLRSGEARGRYPLTVGVETPDGQALPPQTLDVMLEGEDRGVNLILNLGVPALEGLYWFSVTLNDQELTRTPFRVTYQRMPGTA